MNVMPRDLLGVNIETDEMGVDSVNIPNVNTFKMHRVNKDGFWICVEAGGVEHVFWVRSSEMIKVEHVADHVVR